MNSDINGLVFSVFIILLLLILSFVLRSGHGAFLINGYNIMSKEKKALYNEKALCVLFGNLLLLDDFIIIIILLLGILEITWLVIIFTLIMIVISISTVIYAFTNDRFRK